MSEYYMVGADLTTAQSVIFKHDFGRVDLFDYLSSSDRVWSGGTVEFVIAEDDDIGSNCEVISLIARVLIVANRVREVWGRCFADDVVEWIPASYREERWWILRSKIVLDAVREEESSLVRSRTGAVIAVHEITLDRSACLGHEIFSLSRGLQSWHQVISASAMKSWSDSGFKGLCFHPVRCR